MGMLIVWFIASILWIQKALDCSLDNISPYDRLIIDMRTSKAIDLLSDGHSIYTVKKSREICKILKLKLPQNLIIKWKNRKDAMTRYGFNAKNNKPASGVYSLTLSNWACRELTGGIAGAIFHGRGSRARGNAEAIKEKLNL